MILYSDQKTQWPKAMFQISGCWDQVSIRKFHLGRNAVVSIYSMLLDLLLNSGPPRMFCNKFICWSLIASWKFNHENFNSSKNTVHFVWRGLFLNTGIYMPGFFIVVNLTCGKICTDIERSIQGGVSWWLKGFF